MKILGIDPGTAIVGYGLIEHKGSKSLFLNAGVITTSKTLSDSKRLADIADGVALLLKEEKPEIVVIEKIFFSKNIKTAIGVAQARGVILATIEKAGVPIYECSPQDVKMAVTGSGNAKKDQVQRMVKVLLNLPEIPKPDDAADALAAALSVTSRLKMLKLS